MSHTIQLHNTYRTNSLKLLRVVIAVIIVLHLPCGSQVLVNWIFVKMSAREKDANTWSTLMLKSVSVQFQATGASRCRQRGRRRKQTITPPCEQGS